MPSLESNAVVWGWNGVEVLTFTLQTTSPGNVSKAYFWAAKTCKHKYQLSKNIFTFLRPQLGIQSCYHIYLLAVSEPAFLPRDIWVNKGCPQRCRTVSQASAQSLNTILHSSWSLIGIPAKCEKDYVRAEKNQSKNIWQCVHNLTRSAPKSRLQPKEREGLWHFCSFQTSIP